MISLRAAGFTSARPARRARAALRKGGLPGHVVRESPARKSEKPLARARINSAGRQKSRDIPHRVASPRLASPRAEVVVANINGHRWALPRSRCAVVDRHRSSIVVIIVARIRRNHEAYSEKVPRAARFLARARARARVEAHAVYILCVTLSFYPGLAAPSRV